MKYSKEDKKLISSFVQAQKDIEHFYLQALREKNLKKAKYYADQAKALVDLLQEEYQSWALTRWSQEYLKGFKQVEHLKRGISKQTVELGEDQIMLQVGKFHKQALLALVQNGNRAVSATLDGMKKDIVYGLALFNQKGKEIWLQHQIQSQLGAGILTGKALHYQKSDLVAFFQKKGLQLRDRSGRKRDPHTYAEMLIRTETARAYNAGIINRALELWTSKFRIEESWNCCSICAQYNGKVVDINKGGYDLPPYHPNCRGTIVPVWEEVEGEKIPENELMNLLDNLGKKNRIAYTINELNSETTDILYHLWYEPKKFTHQITNQWIQHIYRRHWAGKEKNKNQIPVWKQDIKLIPEIIKNYDTLKLSGKKSLSWNDVIIFKKQIKDKEYTYASFINTKTHSLDPQTMYIKKKK